MNTKIIPEGRIITLFSKELVLGKLTDTCSKDLSAGKTMHTQRNNLFHPEGACGPTSGANALVSAETVFEYDKKYQLEDAIMKLLMSKEAYVYLQSIDPGAKYNPWNASACIVWAVNKIAGRTVCELQEVTLAMIMYYLVKNDPVVMGGKFTPSRHFVTTVGFHTKQTDIAAITGPDDVDVKAIISMIIDDSWGNYLTKYRSADGNSNILPIKTYTKIAMDGKRIKTAQVYYYQGIKNFI